MMTSGTGTSLGEAEAAALLASENLLSRDDIPDENQQADCFSCGETLTGLFCHSCGQKNDDYRRSIWSLFTETFTSIFSLENRMWRSWLMLLLKPGLVPREFSDGKRTKWTSPVRIYLALSIMLFGYMSLTETRIFSIRTDIVPKNGIEADVSKLDDSAVRLVPDFGFFRRQAEIDRLNSNTDFDRVTRLIRGIEHQAFNFDGDLSVFGSPPTKALLVSSGSWPSDTDTISEIELLSEATENYKDKVEDVIDRYNLLLIASKNPTTIASRIVDAEEDNRPFDLLSQLLLSENEDVNQISREALRAIEVDLEKLGLSLSSVHDLPIVLENTYSFDLGTTQVNGMELSEVDFQKLSVEILKNPALLNEGISTYLPRIMFLMMPFAAIIGIVFIRGKKTALLYDHLVHATYIHAVVFAFLLLLILIAQWTPLSGMILPFFVGIAIYLPISAKRMFKRGWFKTFFASYSIAFLYGITMFIVVTALTANSIVEAASSSLVITPSSSEALALYLQTTTVWLL